MWATDSFPCPGRLLLEQPPPIFQAGGVAQNIVKGPHIIFILETVVMLHVFILRWNLGGYSPWLMVPVVKSHGLQVREKKCYTYIAI